MAAGCLPTSIRTSASPDASTGTPLAVEGVLAEPEALARLGGTLPNTFVWWDDRLRERVREVFVEGDTADLARVVRAVLDGLKLSDADFDRGIAIAIDELRKTSAEGWQPL